MEDAKREKFLGKFLRAKRNESGIKQGYMAGKLGISSPFLSQLETGQRTASIGLYEKYGDMFGIDIYRELSKEKRRR